MNSGKPPARPAPPPFREVKEDDGLGTARRRQRGRRGTGTWDERKSFEQDFCLNHPHVTGYVGRLVRKPDGSYLHDTVQMAWESWQERGRLGFRTVLPSTPDLAEIQELAIKAIIKSTTGEAAVDQNSYFRHMRGADPCPIGVKVQLLNPGNVAVYGVWNGRDTWPKGWAPLPKIPDDMR